MLKLRGQLWSFSETLFVVKALTQGESEDKVDQVYQYVRSAAEIQYVDHWEVPEDARYMCSAAGRRFFVKDIGCNETSLYISM